MSFLQIINFDLDRFKTATVLKEYEILKPDATVGDLCICLKKLERNDVLADMDEYFSKLKLNESSRIDIRALESL